MAKRGRKNKAEVNKQLFQKANNYYRKKWFTDSQKSMDFFLNEQLSAQEQEDLREGGMPDFIINRITPAIEVMKYFVTANNPKWQAIGVEGSDSDIAHVHSMIAEYCWHLSNGKNLFSSVIQDALVKGMGLFRVDINPDGDEGMGEVIFNSIDPYDVYVDPMSRDFLFRDASYIIVQKNLSKTSLTRLFPQFKKKIVRANGSPESKQYSMRDIHESENIQPGDVEFEAYTLEGEQDEILDYYEVYTKEQIAYVNVWSKQPPSPEEIKLIQQEAKEQMEFISKDMEVSLKEKELELMQLVQEGEILPERMALELEKAQKDAVAKIEEQQAIIEAQLVELKTKTVQHSMEKKAFDLLMKDENYAKNVVEVVDFFKTQIKMCASVGDMYLYEVILPMADYPIIPVIYSHTGTPYPMGAVLPMIGKQREINKAHQIMLHNANLASNLRWLYTEGSVDEEEWEKYSSSPGAMLKYRQGFDPPTPVQPLPINNAFYTVTQQGKQDIEYISGVASSMSGVGDQSHETYRGMLAMDEYGTRRIRQWVNTIVEPALEHMGRIFKEIAQFTYTSQKVFRIVQPEAGASEGEVQEVSINIPIYNDFGETIQRFNDYQSAKFDVRIVAGSTQPVNRWALLDEYFNWFQAGLIDDVAMIEQTDIRNKKALMQRKSMYAQMQQQIVGMEEQIKDQEGTIETLERQVIQAGIKDKINEGSKMIDKEVLDTQAQQRLLQGRMKDTVDLAKKELALEKKKISVDKQKK
jgi:hypothetical protein|tara:strand:- start:669 stop:2921 length:2253 start_codon:yes stop_codon:yes gene_type:complete